MAEQPIRELQPGESKMELADGKVAIIHPDRPPVIIERDGKERRAHFWELGWVLH